LLDAFVKGYRKNEAVYGKNPESLIKCDISGEYSSCSVITDIKYGYFINEGFEKSSYPLISCDKNGCTYITGESSCSNNVGKVLKSSLKLCISNNDNDAKQITKEGTELTKLGISLSSIGYFPGSLRN